MGSHPRLAYLFRRALCSVARSAASSSFTHSPHTRVLPQPRFLSFGHQPWAAFPVAKQLSPRQAESEVLQGREGTTTSNHADDERNPLPIYKTGLSLPTSKESLLHREPSQHGLKNHDFLSETAFLKELGFTNNEAGDFLKRGLVFSSREEQDRAREVVAVYRKHGLSRGSIATQFLERRKWQLQDSVEIEKQFEVLLNFGVPRRSVPAVYKEARACDTASTLQQKFEDLVNLGFADPGRLVSRSPRILKSSAANWEEKTQVVGKDKAIRVMEKTPDLLLIATETFSANIKVLEEWCGKEAATKRVFVNAYILRSSTDSILTACELLQTELGLSKEEVRKFLLSCPALPPPETAREGMQQSITMLGRECLKSLIMKESRFYTSMWPLLSTFEGIKVELSKSEALFILDKNPGIFAYNWEETIKPKMTYLASVLKQTRTEILCAPVMVFTTDLLKLKATVKRLHAEGIQILLRSPRNAIAIGEGPVICLSTALTNNYR